jgi:hypothetical protein
MTKATETALRLLESLPEEAQEKVVAELRQLVQEAQDEFRWAQLFSRNSKLREAARRARQEAIQGKATEMDYERL